MELKISNKDLDKMSLAQLRALRDEYETKLRGLTLKDANRYDLVNLIDAIDDAIWDKECLPMNEPITGQRKPANELTADQIKSRIERNKRQVEALVERYLEGSDEEISKLLININDTQEALKTIHILGNGKKQPSALLTELRRYFNEILELKAEIQRRKDVKDEKRRNSPEAKKNRDEIVELLTTDPFLNEKQ